MGPLEGVRAIEIAGIGPGPFCAMMLSDMGAEVLRGDRAASVREGGGDGVGKDLLNRGRRSIGLLLAVDGDSDDPAAGELLPLRELLARVSAIEGS